MQNAAQACRDFSSHTRPSSATLPRLLVPVPQLVNLALELLHVVEDVAGILPAVFCTSRCGQSGRGKTVFGFFPWRVQRVLVAGLVLRRRVVMP